MTQLENRNKSLDALRGIFACLVVIMHIDIITFFKKISIIQHAYVFVDFFFVLSAFVLYNSYIKNNFTIKYLIIKRIKRLIPLHYFMLILFFLFELFKKYYIENRLHLETHSFSNETSIYSFFCSVFLFDSFGFFENNIWNAPAWSISAELYSYILFIILANFNKLIRNILYILLGFFLLIFSIKKGTTDYGQKFGIIRCLWSYYIVIFFLQNNIYKYLINKYLYILSIIIVIIYFLFSLQLKNYEFFLPIIFTIIIFNIYYSKKIILNNKFTNLIGELSYSIYLSQAFIIIIIDDLLVLLSRKFSNLFYIENHLIYFSNNIIGVSITLITILLIIIFSFFTNKYIENIFLKKNN